MLVKKHSGELVPYNERSLRHSLTRSGALEHEVAEVLDSIQENLYNGITTRELYQLAFEHLKMQKDFYAARYSLKKALRDLGPEGFFFEEWISRLFAHYGFQTTTGQTVQGHAVSHEIDVIAVKNNRMLAIECKFRNDVDAKISVTTPMYFKSRFRDIRDNISFLLFDRHRYFTEGWLITNAYFTADSIRFAEYYKMNLLGWDYPDERSIKLQVDNTGVYPITCLTTLNDKNKITLLKNNCIVIKDLLNEPSLLNELAIDEKEKARVIREAQNLLNTSKHQ